MIKREISDKKFQMDALDGLRGFAALIVVLSHTSNLGMFVMPFLDLRGIGKSGVFLFFLLSSFLLTLPLLNQGKKILTLPVMSHYWQRRFLRIYPLYTLYLLTGVLSTWFVATFIEQNDIAIPFSLDWIGFFKHLTLQEGRGVTWSIAVEFKFYFILPVLAFALVSIRSYNTWGALVFLLLLLLLSQIITPQSESLINDSRMLPYMPIFLIGMLLAVIQNDINHKIRYTRYLKYTYKYLGYIGLIGISAMTPLIYSLLNDHVPSDYFHRQFILYTLLWSFVLLSAVNVRGPIQWFFTLPILRFYGALSFSLYLFHVVFIDILRLFDLNPYVNAWIVLLGSTASAYISFSLLERPVSQYKFFRNSPAPISQ